MKGKKHFYHLKKRFGKVLYENYKKYNMNYKDEYLKFNNFEDKEYYYICSYCRLSWESSAS